MDERVGATQAFHALMAYLRAHPSRFDEAEELLLALLDPGCELAWQVPRGLDELAIGRHVMEFRRAAC